MADLIQSVGIKQKHLLVPISTRCTNAASKWRSRYLTKWSRDGASHQRREMAMSYATFESRRLSPCLRRHGKPETKARRTDITSQPAVCRQSRAADLFVPCNRRLWRHVTGLFRKCELWNSDISIYPHVWDPFLTCQTLRIATTTYKKQNYIDLLIQFPSRRKTLHLNFNAWSSRIG